MIDLHGESPWEKAAFATALDGQISALVGTHTHDPTLRGHILPAGTGYVTELGMTGRLGFTGGGFDPVHFAAQLRGEDISALPPTNSSPAPSPSAQSCYTSIPWVAPPRSLEWIDLDLAATQVPEQPHCIPRG